MMARSRPAIGFGRSALRWPGYAACALGLLYAAVSAYWALGGDAGLATVGGAIEDLARSRTPLALAVAWGAVLLKGFAALLALPLVRAWGLRLPRHLFLLTCWGASAILILYGGVFVAVGALVLAGIIPGAPPEQQFALRWHVALWDLWFFLWGWRSPLLPGSSCVVPLRAESYQES